MPRYRALMFINTNVKTNKNGIISFSILQLFYHQLSYSDDIETLPEVIFDKVVVLPEMLKESSFIIIVLGLQSCLHICSLFREGWTLPAWTFYLVIYLACLKQIANTHNVIITIFIVRYAFRMYTTFHRKLILI